MTANTSDYECPDGDLEVSLGTDLGENSIQPGYKPTLEFTLPNGDGDEWRIMCVHNTPDFKHYIVRNTAEGKENLLGYVDAATTPKGGTATVSIISPYTDADGKRTYIGDDCTIEQACTIGNTLVLTIKDTVTQEGKMIYFLWRKDRYMFLDSDIPEVDIQFSLTAYGKFYSWQKYDAEKDGKRNGRFSFKVPDRTAAETLDFNDKQKDEAGAAVMGRVARFVNEVGNKAGKFVYPFFVRYAYRLYDGSYTRHSAPVLMTPCSAQMPLVIAQNEKNSETSDVLENCDIFATPCRLNWQVSDTAALGKLRNEWKDVVKDICIFVSPPIYTYDQSGKPEGLKLMRREAQDWYNEPYENLMLAQFATGTADTDEEPEGFCNDFYYRNAEDFIDDDSTTADICNAAVSSMELKLNNANGIFQWWDVAEMCKLFYMGVPQYLFGEGAASKYVLSPKSVYRVMLPSFTGEEIKKRIKSTASFFLLKSVNVQDDFSGNSQEDGVRKPVSGLDPQYLSALTAHERLPDDFLSHDVLYPKLLRDYNSRLHIGDITRYFYDGYNPVSMLPRQTEFRDVRLYHGDADKALKGEEWLASVFKGYVQTARTAVRWTVETNSGKQITVGGEYPVMVISDLAEINAWDTAETEYKLPHRQLPMFLYYPSPMCKRVRLFCRIALSVSAGVVDYKDKLALDMEMQEHEFLYGSFFLGGVGEGKSQLYTSPITAAIPPLSDDRAVHLRNGVYISEAANPFKFSATNTLSVGSGTLLGIVPAVEALSQGQFGEYPMYALTSEGVWSLRPNEQGVYVTVRPVSRDVCNNPGSITQIDHSVVFTTEQGLMMLHGNTTDCLSDILDTTYAPSPLSLPKLKDVLLKQGVKESDIPSVPFRTFLSGALLMYDYSGKRIIVYNPEKASDGTPLYSYAYVYFIKGRRWGVMPSVITASANTYPDAVAQDKDGNILNLSLPDYLNGYKGVLVTRPFKLGQHDMLKTVDTIIQRGKLRRNHVSQILYASNDLIDWMPVWSSGNIYMRGFRGTPYKYFKLAIRCDLGEGESLYGFTVQFTPRLQDQPR